MRISCLACYLPVLLFANSGCGSNIEVHEFVGTSAERVVVVDNANCKIELLKVDYDQPGAGSDYMELFVTKKSAAVTTLAGCGLGAIALYLSSSCSLPYLTVPVQTVTIPSDGYVGICDGCDVDPGAPDWMDNGAAEFGFFSSLVLQAPPLWVSYEGTPKCIPAGGTPVVKQLQSETDQAPNLANVSCNDSFVLVNATLAVRRKPNPCPSQDAGVGGTGGTGGGGTGGVGASGGSGGTGGGTGGAGTGGTGATGGVASGGTGGTGATGGVASGGTGGMAASGGTSGAGGLDGGEDSGDAGLGDAGPADAGPGGAGAGGSGAHAGVAGASGTGAAAGAGSGGLASGGTGGGTGGAAGAGATQNDGGLSLSDINIAGGGCNCRGTPRGPLAAFGPWLVGLSVLLLRRRRTH